MVELQAVLFTSVLYIYVICCWFSTVQSFLKQHKTRIQSQLSVTTAYVSLSLFPGTQL